MEAVDIGRGLAYDSVHVWQDALAALCGSPHLAATLSVWGPVTPLPLSLLQVFCPVVTMLLLFAARPEV